MITIYGNILLELGHQGSNNSIIRTADGLVLIDAPLRPSDAVAWKQIAERYGVTRYLINTDHHPDHTFGNRFLNGEIIGHRGTRELLMSDPSQGSGMFPLIEHLDPDGYAAQIARKNYTTRIPSITFTDKMTLNVADVAFELLHAPGHTKNTIVVYLPDQEILFCGDAICEAGIPSFVDANTFEWLDTISRLEKLNLRYLVTGHGELCGPEIIGRFRNELQEVVGEVERRIDLGHDRVAIIREVTYEDRIHTAVNGWKAFPDAVLRIIIERSIERIHDDIQNYRASSRSS